MKNLIDEAENQLIVLSDDLKRVNDENSDLKIRFKQSQDEVAFLTSHINELTATIEQEHLNTSMPSKETIKEIKMLKCEMFTLQ